VNTGSGLTCNMGNQDMTYEDVLMLHVVQPPYVGSHVVTRLPQAQPWGHDEARAPKTL